MALSLLHLVVNWQVFTININDITPLDGPYIGVDMT